MTKTLTFKTFGLILAVLMTLTVITANVALAKDIVLDTKISQLVVKNDKNGDEYVRMICPVELKVNGIPYTKGMAVMAFGAHSVQAKQLSEGDRLHAIASESEYKGRTSFVILHYLD